MSAFQTAAEAWQAAAAVDPQIAPHARLAFESLEVLSEGSRETVERVRDRRNDRVAALKRLSDPAAPAACHAALRREASLTVRLDHPALPRVLESGLRPSGDPYILLRYIDGQTLRQAFLDPDGTSLRDGLRLLTRLAEALAAAHAGGLVHRNLSPDNVMVGRYGEVVLLDWGSARDLKEPVEADRSRIAELTAATGPDAAPGTPGYTAPEVLAGESGDELSDVFSLGCLLTELLTGVPPIAGRGSASRRTATLDGEIAAPSELAPRVPPALDSLARGCLELDPHDRIPSATWFAAELRRYLAGERLLCHHYGPLERLKGLIGRNPGALLVVTTLLAGSLPAALLVREEQEVQAEAAVAREERVEAIQSLARTRSDAWRAAEARESLRDARRLALQTGGGESCETVIRRSLALTNRSAEVLLEAAEILRLARRDAAARELYEEAIKADPPGWEGLIGLHRLETRERRGRVPIDTPALARIRELGRRRSERNRYTRLAEIAGRFPGTEPIRDGTRFREGAAEVAKLFLTDPEFVAARLLCARLKLTSVGFRSATRDLEVALKVQPHDLDIIRLFGRANLRSGQDFKIFQLANEGLAVRPGNAELLVLRGRATIINGLPGFSVSSARAALRTAPDDAEAHELLVDALLAQGKPDRALEASVQAVKLFPADPVIAEVHARALHHGGRLEDAERFLAEATGRLDAPRLVTRRARLLLKLDRDDEAKAVLDAALAKNPDSPELLTGLGYWHMARRDYQSAYNTVYRACDIHIYHPRALAMLGYFLAAKRPDPAKEYLSIANDVDPRDGDVRLFRALTMRRIDGPQAGLDALTRNIDHLRSRRRRCLAERAELLTRLGRPTEALFTLKRAFEPGFGEPLVGRNLAQALVTRARTHDRLQRHDEAKPDWDRALALEPVPAWFIEAARSRLAAGALDEALALLDAVAEPGGPHKPSSQDLMNGVIERVRVQIRQGRPADALESLATIMKDSETALIPNRERARLHELAGRVDAALTDYEFTLRSHPDDIWSLARRAQLRLEAGKLEPKQALETADRLLKREPWSRCARHLRIAAARRLGRTKEVRRDMLLLLELAVPGEREELRAALDLTKSEGGS